MISIASAQATELCSISPTNLAVLGIYALTAVGVQSGIRHSVFSRLLWPQPSVGEFARTCVRFSGTD